MKIYVKSEDFGFFTQTPLSVEVKTPDGEVLFCNHEGAREVEDDHDIWNPVTSDHITYTTKVLVCKCGAYKREHEDWWEDAPSGGKHED